jgi:hypothetical protein
MSPNKVRGLRSAGVAALVIAAGLLALGVYQHAAVLRMTAAALAFLGVILLKQAKKRENHASPNRDERQNAEPRPTNADDPPRVEPDSLGG